MNPQTVVGLSSLANPTGPNAADALSTDGRIIPVTVASGGGAGVAGAKPDGSSGPSIPSTSGAPEAWWKRLLPTVGGIVGGIGGGLLGGAADVASLGALAPVINPFTAGIAGASVGGGAGRAAENALTGQKVLQGDDVTSGLQQGAGQAVGEGIGYGLSKGIGALGGLAASRASSLTDAADAAAQQEQADQEAADAAQAEQDKAAANKNNFGGVNSGVQAANNLKDNQALLSSFGHDATNPQVMNDMSKGGLFIDNVDKEALAQGQPVKTADLISNHDITQASPEEQQALINSGIVPGQGMPVPAEVTPQQANAFAQDLGSQLRDTKATLENAKANGRGQDVTQLKQQFNNIKTLYNRVQSVAATPEVNAAIEARTVSPEEKQALVDQFGQKEADYIEEKVNSAQTHQDLVSAKLPFAQMDNVSSQALKDMQATGTPREVARVKAENPVPKPGAATSGNLLTSPAATAAEIALAPLTHGVTALPAAYNVARATVNNPAILNGIANVALGKGVTTGLPLGLGAVGNFVAGASNPATPTGGINLTASNTANGGNMNPTPQNIFTSQSPQDQAIALQALLGMYAPSLLNSTVENNAQSAEQQIQRANQASAALGNLTNPYAAAGGAQGTLGGGLAELEALIPGTPANTYNRERSQAVQQIANATGVPSSEVLLPQLTQTQPSSQSAIASVQALLNLAGANTGTNPTSGTQ